MIENKKGFTLIELMVVMAIIGILAVVALVAISGKSSEARDSRRLADANRIQFAFALHAIDHGSDYLEGGWPGVLLNELSNRTDVTYLDLANVKDPIESRTDICYDGVDPIIRCNQVGGYTVFDIYDDSGDQYLGTFDNYAIGIKLENTESLAYLDNLDWRKIVGIKKVYAATCGDLICETADGENILESSNYCPDDCPCNNNFSCDVGESIDWCYCDCGGVIGCSPGPGPVGFCGDALCSAAESVSGTCPSDCGDGGAAGHDENDWLYISPAGVMRTSFADLDLYNYTYSD